MTQGVKSIFLILGMTLSGILSAQGGIYSICGFSKPTEVNTTWHPPEWNVKSVDPIQWNDNSTWKIKKEDVLKYLMRRDLEVYRSWIWSMDTPVTFVGRVRYQNGKLGMVAIAEHRVCLTEGDEKKWFFQWNEKFVPR